MRTTINLDEDLLRELKQLAASSRKTLGDVIEDALRESLAKMRSRSTRPQPTDLPISEQPLGLRPGVDLDNTASLLDVMEGNDAAA